MTNYAKALSLLLMLLIAHLPAKAVEWNADGVEFANGWTLHGTFDFDSDTGVMSNSNLRIRQVVRDETSPVYFFISDNPGDSSATRISFVSPSGFPDFTDYAIVIDLQESLVAASGTIEADIAGDTFIAPCDFNGSTCVASGFRTQIVQGRFVSSGEPISETRWYLDNVEFSDGGKAQGYYDLLSNSNLPGDFDVRTTDGDFNDGNEYFFADAFQGSNNRVVTFYTGDNLADLTGQTGLQLVANFAISVYGGELRFDAFEQASYEFVCSNSGCTSGNILRDVINGSFIAAPVIEYFECSTSAQAIPDNGSEGTTSNLTSNFSGQILDVNALVQISHARVNDLTITLENVETGVTTLLMSEQTDDSGENCAFANANVSFDDDATVSVDGVCESSDIAVSGSLAPLGSLTQYDGDNFRGSWRLNVVDNVAGVTGTLDQWCVQAKLVSGPSGRDIDDDGIVDSMDNCTLTTNSMQIDTDGDGLGNQCDFDIHLPNDCQTNFLDYVTFVTAFDSTPANNNWNADADVNGDEIVNFLDLAQFSDAYLRPVGPSTVPNICF